MIDTLIDVDGTLWPCHTPSLGRRLGSSLTASDLSAFVVRNMGWAGIGNHATGVHVSIRPATLHPLTLARMIQWLASQHQSRYLVSSLEETELWTHHVCGSLVEAMQKIVALTEPYAVPRDRHLSRALAPRDLVTDDRLGGLWDLWKNASGQPTLQHLLPLLHDRLNGRYVVVSPNENGDLPIVATGDGLPLLNGHWARQAAGSRLQDGLDVYYSNWAAKGYLEAHRTDLPRFEAMDAVLKIPQQAEQRLTYRRLILPIKSQEGSRALLSASVLDAGIDLRFQAR